mgnify:CR=1 FL=1
MISAGEASGDAHAAHALDELRESGVPFNAFGMGAGALAASGTELIVDCRDLAVIGIVDVLINYPRFLKRLRLLRDTMRDRRPDLLIIVDYPDFNLKLAETARDLDIPVLFYISPQVWAWRAGRVERIASLVAHMAVLFPFEVEVYEQAGVPVTHVGHPLVDDARSPYTKEEARLHLGLAEAGPLVTLLPGSRNGEIRRQLPVMLDSARLLVSRHPDLHFVLPLAPTLSRAPIDALLTGSALPITLIEGQACNAIRAADAVLTSSGTATLETALIGTPMVIIYIIAPLNYAIMNRMIRIPDIGLVNIVAGHRIAPEYLQRAATPEVLSEELHCLLTDRDRADVMRLQFDDVREAMGPGGASQRVARLIGSLLPER